MERQRRKRKKEKKKSLLRKKKKEKKDNERRKVSRDTKREIWGTRDVSYLYHSGLWLLVPSWLLSYFDSVFKRNAKTDSDSSTKIARPQLREKLRIKIQIPTIHNLLQIRFWRFVCCWGRTDRIIFVLRDLSWEELIYRHPKNTVIWYTFSYGRTISVGSFWEKSAWRRYVEGCGIRHWALKL